MTTPAGTTMEELERRISNYLGAYSSSQRNPTEVASAHSALWFALAALLAERDTLQKDEERYRWLRQYLHVGADGPGEWTCWLILDQIPIRSQTDSAEELLDLLIARFPLDAALAAQEKP